MAAEDILKNILVAGNFLEGFAILYRCLLPVYIIFFNSNVYKNRSRQVIICIKNIKNLLT